MKRLIFLKTDYLDTTKLNQSKENLAREKMFKAALKAFKQQMETSPRHKILKQMPPNQLIIEYSDKEHENMMYALCQAEVVETIDANISEQRAEIKEQVRSNQELDDLKNRMAKYRK